MIGGLKHLNESQVLGTKTSNAEACRLIFLQTSWHLPAKKHHSINSLNLWCNLPRQHHIGTLEIQPAAKMQCTWSQHTKKYESCGASTYQTIWTSWPTCTRAFQEVTDKLKRQTHIATDSEMPLSDMFARWKSPALQKCKYSKRRKKTENHQRDMQAGIKPASCSFIHETLPPVSYCLACMICNNSGTLRTLRFLHRPYLEHTIQQPPIIHAQTTLDSICYIMHTRCWGQMVTCRPGKGASGQQMAGAWVWEGLGEQLGLWLVLVSCCLARRTLVNSSVIFC